eukprot:COSAG01_NODE_20845_length_932_cov_1.208884_1_plen_239_part_00
MVRRREQAGGRKAIISRRTQHTSPMRLSQSKVPAPAIPCAAPPFLCVECVFGAPPARARPPPRTTPLLVVSVEGAAAAAAAGPLAELEPLWPAPSVAATVTAAAVFAAHPQNRPEPTPPLPPQGGWVAVAPPHARSLPTTAAGQPRARPPGQDALPPGCRRCRATAARRARWPRPTAPPRPCQARAAATTGRGRAPRSPPPDRASVALPWARDTVSAGGAERSRPPSVSCCPTPPEAV